MASPPFQLDSNGYFRRQGERIVPVGVNYWPASCGVEMWPVWPAAEIKRDLDLVRSLGLNCVRFFLRWEDFEPRPGQYDRTAFRRLEELLGWCRERSLLAHPSLFVGWMSGGIFWPRWLKGRNLFSDPEASRRAARFAGRAAKICARFADTVIAVDQGNEICCLPDCLAAPPADVAAWCQAVNAAVTESFPGALLVSGNEQNQIVADTGWRLGAQPGCDFHSMHTYPLSAWHSLAFDGMGDPLARSLLPFYTKCARAFGPVMIQEFGTLLTRGARQCDGYLQSVLPACWAAGANGFLWWCLRDIRAAGHPYNKNGFEQSLGLVDEQGKVKPSLRYFLDFAAELAQASAPVRRPDTALYWPEHYYPRDNPLNPGNSPRQLSRRLAVGHFALGALGRDAGIVRGSEDLRSDGPRLLVITGALLTDREVLALTEWVRGGGHLLWHGVDARGWSPALERLAGAHAVDFRAPLATGIRAFGRTWEFKDFSGEVFLEVVPVTAKVVAKDNQRRPVVIRNRVGKGRVVLCLAQPDDAFAAETPDPANRKHWARWYQGMMGAAAPRRLRPRG